MRGILRLAGLALTVSCAAGGVRAQDGNFLTNIFKYGGTTVPPSQPKELEEAYCPPVDVSEGGAALQTYGGRGGDKSGLRSQIMLSNFARECTRRQDGSITVRVGVEGRVLLGPAGAPGRFEAPLQIAIKFGDKVVASRARRLVATVPAGQAQGTFSIVEEDLSVPAEMTRDYEIEVGLGGPRRPSRAPARGRPPVAAASPGGDAPSAEP